MLAWIVRVESGGVGTGPRNDSLRVLDAGSIPHAGDKPGTHVDQDILRWTDHWIELWMYFDR